MKKLIYFFLLVFIGTTLSCNKENIVKEVSTKERIFSEEEMVWVTPNGYVIPATERNHWEKYIAQTFNEKAPKGYESSSCTTESIKCGLKCSASRLDNCSKEMSCTPCMNCGCTPIKSPY
ncbi:MAG TPA: hypothetical protein PKN22_04505 [Taishania sp.]|jgi:hypothetical protein|nr:hypothetical protein [Taishania sp.]